MLKTLISTLLVLIAMICVEVLLVSLFTLSMPSQFVFTALDNFSLYMSLMSANPTMAIELALLSNPIFIVQRLDVLQTSQVWGVYFMPVNIIALFLLALLLNLFKKIKINLTQWLWVIFATAVVMFSMFYLRLQTCCTSGPTWLLDLWLFSQVSDPLVDSSMWQDIYINLVGHFTLIQFLISFIGIAILCVVYITATHKRVTV